MISGIYAIVSKLDGKTYIGQSIDVESRLQGHLARLRKGAHPNQYLQFAFNKHSEDSFEFRLVEACEKALLNEKESYYIQLMKAMVTEHGYNLKTGGDREVVYSEESRKRMSDAAKSRERKPFSEETRRKISEAAKKREQRYREEGPRPIKAETRQKLSAASSRRTNFEWTKESREKARNSHKGIHPTVDAQAHRTEGLRKYFMERKKERENVSTIPANNQAE